MRILLIGASGQLGADLRNALGAEQVTAPTHQELDICDSNRVSECVQSVKPELVINTAAFHRTDECETEVERAFRVNAYGVSNISSACKSTGTALLHMSTDYVFDGQKAEPYLEQDPPRPINVYGISKLAGELIIRSELERYFIVRSSGLFGLAGASGKGGNFVNTMLRLAQDGKDIRVVDDQRLSPTHTADLARKIAWLVKSEAYGVWHITNGGDCSWYEFAAAIFQQAGLHPSLSPITTSESGARARRPAYSVLGHGRLQEAAADDIQPWWEALGVYLRELGMT